MKRWFALILAFATLAGCQPVYLTKDTLDQAHEGLPRNLETPHERLMAPLTALTGAPATVTDPDRTPRYLELQEAIAIALENGHVSSRAGAGLGRSDDTLLSFNGGSTNAQSERVRVLAFGPAIAHAAMEAAVSRFDPIFTSHIDWTWTDGIPGVPNIPGFQGLVPSHGARASASILKPLSSGGLASLQFITDYQNLRESQNNALLGSRPLNPQYGVRGAIGLEQPLWKDWGAEINQLLPRFPNISGDGLYRGDNAASTGFNNRQSTTSTFIDRQNEGILISRLRFDQQRTEFERNMHILVCSAEVAYWNLYQKYGQLYALEENLKIMHRAWQENYYRFKQGGALGQKVETYHQIRGQYEEFRGERLRALNEVLAAERELRGILGMKHEDGTRLVPTTPPTLAEFKPDWQACMKDALNLRPELLLARDNVKYHQYLLSIQKNNLKPDLRAFVRYEPFGDGNTLTGNGSFTDSSGTQQPTNALRSWTHSHMADYQVGLNLNVPLGFHAEFAAIRAARLQLTQSYLVLKDQEEKATRFLATQYADIERWYEGIRAHRAERSAYRDALVTLDNLRKGDQKTAGDPQFLEVQRRYAAALVKEYQAIAEYNNSLAKLEWAKGTILRYNNVHISEGALPECVQVRAVEYQKERTRSLVLRARPDGLKQPGLLVGGEVTAPKDLGPAPEAGPLDEKFAPPPQILPAKFEEPAKSSLLPTTPPSSKEELPVNFRPSSAPKTPGTLPKLEPLPEMITPNMGALPTAPGFGAPQAGNVRIEEPAAYSSRIGAQGRGAFVPTVVRGSIGGPVSNR